MFLAFLSSSVKCWDRGVQAGGPGAQEAQVLRSVTFPGTMDLRTIGGSPHPPPPAHLEKPGPAGAAILGRWKQALACDLGGPTTDKKEGDPSIM